MRALDQALGRYTQAEPLLLEASKIQERTLGADHPHTVASLSNLATVYTAMGQKERAEAMNVRRGPASSPPPWPRRTPFARRHACASQSHTRHAFDITPWWIRGLILPIPLGDTWHPLGGHAAGAHRDA